MTNIIRLPWYVNRRKYYRVVVLWSIVFASLLLIRSCDSSGFDATTSARAFITGVRDEPIVDTPKVKVYYMSLNQEQFHLVDSMLWKIHNKVGYELSKKEADEYQSFLSELARYFLMQKWDQDSTKPVSNPKK